MNPGGGRGVVLLACALTLTAVVAGCGGSDEQPVRDADLVQAGADTRVFLAGPGAPLLVMHGTAVEQARGSSSPTECRTRAEALQQQLDGQQALALSSQVPDQELAVALTAERSALARSLSACAKSAAAPADINLPQVTMSVHDRLNDLQVAQ